MAFDVLVLDDPYKSREEADSPRIRDIVWRRYWGDADTRQMPGGVRLLMGTRWRPDDLFGRILEIEGDEWTHIVLPAIGDEETEHEQALWPARYSLEYMREKRDSLLRAQRAREWFSQYQQRPTVEDGTYCVRSWFAERWTTPPKAMRIYIASDYAVTEPGEGHDPDFTEHGVFGFAPDKRLYVLDWWYGQTKPDAWLGALFDLVKRWKPSCVFSRRGVIKNAVEPLMRRMMREQSVSFRHEWMSDAGDKAEKGRSFQGMASMGRVIFANAAWAERVVEQCVQFPGAEHDDGFDVMANMCQAIDVAAPGIVPALEESRERDSWKQVDLSDDRAYRTV